MMLALERSDLVLIKHSVAGLWTLLAEVTVGTIHTRRRLFLLEPS